MIVQQVVVDVKPLALCTKAKLAVEWWDTFQVSSESVVGVSLSVVIVLELVLKKGLAV